MSACPHTGNPDKCRCADFESPSNSDLVGRETFMDLALDGEYEDLWIAYTELAQQLEQRELQALVAFYCFDRRACAHYCDEVRDPSGALLGRVRDAALTPDDASA